MNEEFWRWYMYGHWVCLTQWLGFIMVEYLHRQNMTVFVQHKRNSAILKPVKEAFRADMVTLRWEGNTLLFKSFVAGWKTACGACKRAVYLCFLGCA